MLRRGSLLTWIACSSSLLGAEVELGDHPIPESRRTDWSMAGAAIRTIESVPVVDFLAAHPRAAEDDDIGPELQRLIDSAEGPVQIRLPAGTFRLKTSVVWDVAIHNHPVVLRGAGMEATRILYSPADTEVERAAFKVRGLVREAGEVAVTAGFEKGSRRLTVRDAGTFRPGNTVVLRQDNDEHAMRTARTDAGMPDRQIESLRTWARRATGQTVRLAAIEGDVLVLERPLHLTLDWGGLTALPVSSREQVGFEGFTIENVIDGENIYQFIFDDAADCWIENVRSVKTVKSHFVGRQTRNVTIRGCFFDDSYRHGGGGHGYGVAFEWASSDNLVIDNLFRRLRHSLVFAKGICGNVYAYNYSFENLQDGASVARDLSGHGHYPFMNLLEGNVIEFAHGTDYWGSLGPGNTYYRNRAYVAGFRIDEFSPRQNVIANEITAPPASRRDARWDPLDATVINGIVVHDSVIDPLIFANTTLTDPEVEPDYQHLPGSLFLDEAPDFWPDDLSWPALGPPREPGKHAIPAMLRWEEMKPRLEAEEVAERTGPRSPTG